MTIAYDLIKRAETELEKLKAAVWAYEQGSGSSQKVADQAGSVTACMVGVTNVCR
jgi:hypothetical protein